MRLIGRNNRWGVEIKVTHLIGISNARRLKNETILGALISETRQLQISQNIVHRENRCFFSRGVHVRAGALTVGDRDQLRVRRVDLALGFPRISSSGPSITVSGVRNSWLILVKNADFA